MATFRKRSGGWRAEIHRQGVRDSATFPTKAQAVEWATLRESEIMTHQGLGPHHNDHTLRDAIERYVTTVSPTKKGARWEQVRLAAFAQEARFIDSKIQDVQADAIAQWRDSRLSQVAPSTVNREMTLISGVFNYAVKEWRWCTANPVTQVRRPKDPPPRDRRIRADEIERMLEQLHYREGLPPQMLMQELAIVFLLALETAMRQGEILGLDWSRVHLKRRFVHLDSTKNSFSRDVPLSLRAVELLDVMGEKSRSGQVFSIRSGSADTLFRKARRKAGLDDLNFHDTRHEAITRLARKLDVLDLARMTGHKNIRNLMIYYNATASEVASRLD